MAEIVDEETPRAAGAQARGFTVRTQVEENVPATGGKAEAVLKGEDDKHVGRAGRAFKASTEKLLADMENEDDGEETEIPAHEQGDADEGESDGEASDDDGETVDDAGESEGESDEDEPDAEAAEDNKAARLEKRNRELISELEEARKTPKAQRTDREAALVAAEAAYFDEGSVASVRRLLAVITGTAHDSKEVDAELSGLYTDLTARELGVALDDNQRSLRDNARTRLLLARDKREKAEADKKPAVDNSAAGADFEKGTKHVEGLLATKTQSGTSIADEYPMLMTLARHFDNYGPAEVIARAVHAEIMTGTLDPNASDIEMVRHVAPKIEKHYDALAKKIEAARSKTKKTDTTTPSSKSKAAVAAGTEQRQSPVARNITTAAASRAPAKQPKAGQQKAPTEKTQKSRKDFPTDKAWKEHLLTKHFPS